MQERRPGGRRGEGQTAEKTRVAANLITFDRRRKLPSPLRKFNVPETRVRSEKGGKNYIPMYSASR